MAFTSQRASERSCRRLRQHSERLRSTLPTQWCAAARAPNPPDGAVPRWFHDGIARAQRRWRAR